MKLASYFKKGNILTVTDGLCQAMDKGIGFIEYLPKAAGLTFAVNAAAFIDGIKVLNDNYRIILNNDDYVLLFDDEQEIRLKHKEPDITLQIPTSFDTVWQVSDITATWNKINDFVNPLYPAIKCTETYLETITTESAVRASVALRMNEQENYVIAYKVPTSSVKYTFDKLFLWLQYSEQCFIALSLTSAKFPNTDNLFNGIVSDSLIPIGLHKQITKADSVKFTDKGLVLSSVDVADQIIEDVKGQGTYSYAFFTKAIKCCVGWSFKPNYLYLESSKIRIVLENIHA